jgi:hypothetical protein
MLRFDEKLRRKLRRDFAKHHIPIYERTRAHCNTASPHGPATTTRPIV